MVVSEPEYAAEFLAFFNYYRFSGYALHFEHFEHGQRTHSFKADTTFEKVVRLCEFDSELRSFFFPLLEKIEIAVKTVLCAELALKYNDSHWFLKSDLFCMDRFDHQKMLEDCRSEFRRSQETFAGSYRRKYSSPELPPSWMIIELLSFGKIAKIYASLKNRSDKKIIAQRFNCSPKDLESWLHSLTVFRNLCAHHARIWNRHFSICARLPAEIEVKQTKKGRLAMLFYVCQRLIDVVDRKNRFKISLEELLARHPQIPLQKMGFELIFPANEKCFTDLNHAVSDGETLMDNKYFVHESSYVDDGVKIGENTKIWHFCHILGNTEIGKDCSFGQNCVVGPKVKIGNNVKVQNNVSIYDGVVLEDDVFCGPSMVFTNVVNPRSHVSRKHEYKKTLLKKGATVGANATVVCGNTLGRYCFIGAGSVVTKDVPDFAMVVGNPGRIKGWMCHCGVKLIAGEKLEECSDHKCKDCGAEYQVKNAIFTAK